MLICVKLGNSCLIAAVLKMSKILTETSYES